MPSTIMKSSRILQMSRADEVGKYVNYTNKPGQKTPNKEIIFVRGNNGMG